jgi:hypothetical protein
MCAFPKAREVTGYTDLRIAGRIKAIFSIDSSLTGFPI